MEESKYGPLIDCLEITDGGYRNYTVRVKNCRISDEDAKKLDFSKETNEKDDFSSCLHFENVIFEGQAFYWMFRNPLLRKIHTLSLSNVVFSNPIRKELYLEILGRIELTDCDLTKSAEDVFATLFQSAFFETVHDLKIINSLDLIRSFANHPLPRLKNLTLIGNGTQDFLGEEGLDVSLFKNQKLTLDLVGFSVEKLFKNIPQGFSFDLRGNLAFKTLRYLSEYAVNSILSHIYSMSVISIPDFSGANTKLMELVARLDGESINFESWRIGSFKHFPEELKGIKHLKLCCHNMEICYYSEGPSGYQKGGYIKSFEGITELEKLETIDIFGFHPEGGIQNLKELEKLPHLREVKILGCDEEIRQLDLKCIKHPDFRGLASWEGYDFSRLEFSEDINLSGATITDFSPLGKATNLVKLNLSKTKIEDLSPLLGLQKIEQLNLESTTVEDFSVLSELKNLKELRLARTTLKDLSFVCELKNLQKLYIAHTQICTLEALRGQNQLNVLDISFTKVDSLLPLKGIPLGELYANGLNKLECLDGLEPYVHSLHLAYCSQLSNLDALNSPAFEFNILNLNYTKVSSLDFLWKSKRHEKESSVFILNLKGCPITSLAPIMRYAISSASIQFTSSVFYSNYFDVDRRQMGDQKDFIVELGERLDPLRFPDKSKVTSVKDIKGYADALDSKVNQNYLAAINILGSPEIIIKEREGKGNHFYGRSLIPYREDWVYKVVKDTEDLTPDKIFYLNKRIAQKYIGLCFHDYRNFEATQYLAIHENNINLIVPPRGDKALAFFEECLSRCIVEKKDAILIAVIPSEQDKLWSEPSFQARYPEIIDWISEEDFAASDFSKVYIDNKLSAVVAKNLYHLKEISVELIGEDEGVPGYSFLEINLKERKNKAIRSHDFFVLELLETYNKQVYIVIGEMLLKDFYLEKILVLQGLKVFLNKDKKTQGICDFGQVNSSIPIWKTVESSDPFSIYNFSPDTAVNAIVYSPQNQPTEINLEGPSNIKTQYIIPFSPQRVVNKHLHTMLFMQFREAKQLTLARKRKNPNESLKLKLDHNYQKDETSLGLQLKFLASSEVAFQVIYPENIEAVKRKNIEAEIYNFVCQELEKLPVEELRKAEARVVCSCALCQQLEEPHNFSQKEILEHLEKGKKKIRCPQSKNYLSIEDDVSSVFAAMEESKIIAHIYTEDGNTDMMRVLLESLGIDAETQEQYIKIIPSHGYKNVLEEPKKLIGSYEATLKEVPLVLYHIDKDIDNSNEKRLLEKQLKNKRYKKAVNKSLVLMTAFYDIEAHFALNAEHLKEVTGLSETKVKQLIQQLLENEDLLEKTKAKIKEVLTKNGDDNPSEEAIAQKLKGGLLEKNVYGKGALELLHELVKQEPSLSSFEGDFLIVPTKTLAQKLPELKNFVKEFNKLLP